MSTVLSATSLRHREEVEAYLSRREQWADSLQERLSTIQPDLSGIRARLLAQRDV